MPFFEWEPGFSVRLNEIDRQHKNLIGLINRLFEVMRPGKQETFDSSLKELVTQASVIEEMISYSHYHFSTEEKYMGKYLYPGFEEHKKEHKSFVDEVERFKADFDSGKVLLSVQIMEFLKKWLGDHILGTDKKFEPFFQAKGLK